MRFTVRSLGAKLIFTAASILLLCMLLFTAVSWSLLKFYTEHKASNNALTHLALLKSAYQEHNTTLIHQLDDAVLGTGLAANIVPPYTTEMRRHLQDILASIPTAYRLSLSELDIVSMDRQILAQQESVGVVNKSLAADTQPIVNQALQGQRAATLRKIATPGLGMSSVDDQWALSITIPIRTINGTQVGILLASQPIDDYFAQELTHISGANVVLCMAGRVQGTTGTTLKNLAGDQVVAASTPCTATTQIVMNGSQSYLAQASPVQAQYQMGNTPSLVIATVEPLDGIDIHNQRLLLLIGGVAVFLFAFGVFSYALITRRFFIRPLHRLKADVQAFVLNNGGTQVEQRAGDEVSTLSHSFGLLTEFLDNENQAMTKQMSNLLIMSDTLISTLNLEHLLGEIVSSLGSILQVKHVSLLLYGREMLSPWAVAQWSEQAIMSYTPATLPSLTMHTSSQHGAVMVHADPDGDITKAVTTKMAAMPGPHSPIGSGKRHAIRPPKMTPAASPYGLRRPRIPRPALRDLDMMLARMAIQRKKIAYGEDIATIYQERHETWARIALETGYRSAISVPLLLQDQAIGAFILYTDKAYQVSSRDMFMLSTVAIQASMAIQNAVLFNEVMEKNAALERANQLKSQFLANVTHELRTPLHSIISYGALILEGFLDGELTKEQEEHIQFMVRRAEDLSHLVDDMLDLSKIEADRIEVKLERLELAQCLTEVINQLKPLANNKGLSLTLETDGRLPMVLADSHRVRQVAINLVSNALKFTEQGGVTIRCTPTSRGDTLRVAIHDTGIGISPAAFNFIFEAFRQADGSTTRRFGGTGLGLTIARKLIELQGGEVAVESVVGHGSTFSFMLPVAPLPDTHL